MFKIFLCVFFNYSTLYLGGSLDAAYGTFLTVLMVEFTHDMLADNVSSEYNVTWGRTSPIIVSVVDLLYETYLTLECAINNKLTKLI